MKNIIITGCNGFIGGQLTEFYCKKNNFNVIGIGREESYIMDKRFEFLKYNLEKDDLTSLYKNINPEIIIHCAGSASVGKSIEFPEIDFNKNVKILYKILFSIKNAKINPQFIFLSSAAVYGNPKRLPIHEEDVLTPISPYGLNKKLCEEICKYFVHNESLNIKILRIFSAYGEGLKKQIFWDMYKKLKYTKGLKLYGTGEETRDFINIKEILNALDLIVSNNNRYRVFNVANGVDIKIRDVSRRFVELMGMSKDIIHFNNTIKNGDPLKWKADINRLKELGYKQSISIDDGIRSYINWLRSIDNE
ncbi:NAD-dependent epimerase/dehydratase family protein [Clostridium tyrobutyricum]|uniref:NAD-dependent epimerase/dehydratase family protein n=1 Tax=Clostridium tyrobutyricum TaxID=1519 RepID=UPI001C37FEC6|nr:NAD-dependent epimerase/dehydratase family protein [Clostridium tyrobutyricum]MBV4428310.1 NAD-dependent epimerase/dehydratase family protein [Clostridium tyrobutyricum]MBV4443300.1 NAD-dependent epimerase/dehydratase family protein [Clostridium tyrobutyricum]